MRRSIILCRMGHQDALQSPDANQWSSGRLPLGLAVLALLSITTWSYWPTGVGLFNAWQSSDDYSAGQLVPLVAVFFIWRKRSVLRHCALVPCWWAGIPLLMVTQIAAIYGLLSFRFSVERYSLVPTIAALILLVLGRRVFRCLFWILLFLFLMFPLPGFLHRMISDPLQRIATTGSVFLLEAVGVPVGQQGNIVILNDDIPMAVAEACSGLRMLTAFIIVAAFVAYVVKRSRLQKAVLVVSSIPIAVISNMIRIFLTAIVMLYVSVEVGEKFFHDFAGLVMMPATVMLIFCELWLMDRLTVPEADTQKGHVIARAQPATLAQDRSARKNGRSKTN